VFKLNQRRASYERIRNIQPRHAVMLACFLGVLTDEHHERGQEAIFGDSGNNDYDTQPYRQPEVLHRFYFILCGILIYNSIW